MADYKKLSELELANSLSNADLIDVSVYQAGGGYFSNAVSIGTLINNSNVASTYLKRDCSNDPLTGELALNTGSTSVAPLKFTSGDLLTDAETGVMEFNNDDLTFSVTSESVSKRKQIVLTDGTNLSNGRIPYSTTNGRLVDSSELTYDGDLHILSDTSKLYFGAGDDASINYDGTDLVIDSTEVGSGDIKAVSDVNIYKGTPKITLTNTGSNEKSTYVHVDQNNDLVERVAETGKPVLDSYSISLNGTSYFENTAISSLVTNDISISLWVNPTSDIGALIDWGSIYIGNERGFLLAIGDNSGANGGRIAWFSGDGLSNHNTMNFSVNGIISTGSWQHLMIVKSGTSINFYKDNVEVYSGTTGTAPISPSNSTLSLGKSPQTYNFNTQYNGLMDEIIIFNRAITSDERDILYNSGDGIYGVITSSPFDNGLVGAWHVDEGSGNITTGFSGSAYVLTGVSSPLWDDGNVSTSLSIEASNIWNIIDGAVAGEKGILTIGDSAGRTIIEAGTDIHLDGNIKLDDYTTDGFVKTSNSSGELIIDTTDYLDETEGDIRYLKLDTSNDPLTGNLVVNANVYADHFVANNNSFSFASGATITSNDSADIILSVNNSTSSILSNNKMSFYVDETTDQLKINVKYSNGASRTGIINLTS